MRFEVDRTASNCDKLERAKKLEKMLRNPMNYEEWSKSIELDRTVTPDSGLRGDDGTNDNEVSEGLRRQAQEEFTLRFEVDRTASNCDKLERAKKLEKILRNPMNYEEWSKSIELDRTVTPDFRARDVTQNEKQILEENDTKKTS